MKAAGDICRASSFEGYIVQKRETRLKQDGSGESEDFFTYQEYHPHNYRQFSDAPTLEFPDFSSSVDEFYSKLENQKVDLKVVQQEKLAMKKLENVIKDRENRLAGLHDAQELDKRRGEMIQMNQDLVEKALLVLRSAIANQMSWEEIGQLVKDAQAKGDPIASTIKQLKLDTNHFTMALRDPYETPAVESVTNIDEGLFKCSVFAVYHFGS
jgi:predicted ribosome quality control (RQC) complex YloA/Tae2 family protein